jgi:Flp pilus assembly protein TadG
MLHMLSYSPALTRLAADRRGVTGIVAAIAATVLLGFCGLAIDVVMWQVQQRTMQGAADQAALAAATAYKNAGETVALGDSTAGPNGAYAAAHANAANWPGSAPTITVAAYNNGSGCTNDGCVKVTITQQQKRYFTGLFSTDAVNVTTSAVGTCNGCGAGLNPPSGGGDACVMALDNSGTGVITASGTPTLRLSNCNLYNNSPNTSATILNGNATIEGCDATHACGSQAFLAQPDIPSGNIDIPITTSASPAADPLAGLTPPTVGVGSCSASLSSTSVPATGSPPSGTAYCAPANNATVTLNPGIYVITGGLSMHAHTSIAGSGVTLYVLGGGTINGTSTLSIAAPTSGPYTGVAIWYGDSSSVTYDGTNDTSFSGAIYAPKTTVTWGGTNQASAHCARLIAGAIDLHGTPNGSFDNSSCPAIAGPVLTSSGVSGTTTVRGSPMLVQ